jgi:hypothetical protein
MPDPAHRPVVTLGKRLLYPLHDSGKLQAVRRPDVKRKPIVLKTQAAKLEDKALFRLMEHPDENRPGLIPSEQRFPVVDLGTDFVPDTLLE